MKHFTHTCTKPWLLAVLFCWSVGNTLFSQTTYTLTGPFWSFADSWTPAVVPPNPLPSGSTIIIATVSAFMNVSVTIQSGASMIINAGSTVFLPSAPLTIEGTCVNQGTFLSFTNFTVGATGAFINQSGSAYLQVGGTALIQGTIQNMANLSISAGDMTVNGSMVNDSLIFVGSTLKLLNQGTNNHTISVIGDLHIGDSAGDFLNNAGGTISNSGTIRLNNPAYFTNAGGILTGTGQLVGNFTNEGTLRPGIPVGAFTILGNFTNSGTLDMSLGNPAFSSQLNITGTGVLGGSLNVTSLGPHLSGDVFTLIQGNFTGNFGGAPSFTPNNPTHWSIDDVSPNYVLTFLGAAMPIDLISFTGKRSGQAIELAWRTASEYNNAFVAIERSADGIRFEEIGRIPGSGNAETPRAYSWLDRYPLPGINYYRLNQRDYDGTATLFPVIAVAYDVPDIRFRVEGDMLRLFLPQTAPHRKGEFILFDYQGRVLATDVLSPGATSWQMSLDRLPAGAYVAFARVNGQVWAERFVR